MPPLQHWHLQGRNCVCCQAETIVVNAPAWMSEDLNVRIPQCRKITFRLVFFLAQCPRCVAVEGAPLTPPPKLKPKKASKSRRVRSMIGMRRRSVVSRPLAWVWVRPPDRVQRETLLVRQMPLTSRAGLYSPSARPAARLPPVCFCEWPVG
jgi:hypothetical protein